MPRIMAGHNEFRAFCCGWWSTRSDMPTELASFCLGFWVMATALCTHDNGTSWRNIWHGWRECDLMNSVSPYVSTAISVSISQEDKVLFGSFGSTDVFFLFQYGSTNATVMYTQQWGMGNFYPVNLHTWETFNRQPCGVVRHTTSKNKRKCDAGGDSTPKRIRKSNELGKTESNFTVRKYTAYAKRQGKTADIYEFLHHKPLK